MTLKQWRMQAGLSARDVAVAIGARSINTIYRYERREQVPRPHFMRRILEISDSQVDPASF